MNSDWIPFAQPVPYTYHYSPYRKTDGWMIAWRQDGDDIEYLTHDGFKAIAADRLEFHS